MAIQSVYPFSPEFFTKISPDIFQRAGQISSNLKNIGLVGLILSAVLGFLIIKKIVRYVNDFFHVNVGEHKSEKGFFWRRFIEFSLLLFIGSLMTVSFFFTSFISSFSSRVTQGGIFSSYIDPRFVTAVDNILILYLLPFFITFLFFFILYKWIPEKVVYVKGAMISALISTILWEAGKRIYAYYLVNISLLSQLKGPIISMILFGFWMELSMGIMLYGAKLSYVFDRGRHDMLD